MTLIACGCGCGDLAHDRNFKRGHNPVKSYRRVGDNSRAHRVIAEAALGKPLPPLAEVHHVDGTRSDSSPLVICQDRSYHQLLHRRARVLAAGGNPNTDYMCSRCRLPKPQAEFYVRRTGRGAGSPTPYCRSCQHDRDVS